MSDILGRVKQFYESLEPLTEGKQLHCLSCGRVAPAYQRYWRVGWPTCHEQTMRLEDKP